MGDKPTVTADKTQKPVQTSKEQIGGDAHAKVLQETGIAPPESMKAAACSVQSPFVDRVITVVSSCEGCFTSVNWNDNGAGISVGKAQWNQKKGEMPNLYARWAEKDPERFKAVFGNHAVKMRDEDWLRSATITKQSELGAKIVKSLNEPTMQQTQTDLLTEKVQRAARLAAEFKHTSELFVAQVADVGNQMGWTGARRALERAKVSEIADEQEAIKALQDATKKRVNSESRDAKLVTEFSHQRQVKFPT
jgi:hypothetical protein